MKKLLIIIAIVGLSSLSVRADVYMEILRYPKAEIRDVCYERLPLCTNDELITVIQIKIKEGWQPWFWDHSGFGYSLFFYR